MEPAAPITQRHIVRISHPPLPSSPPSAGAAHVPITSKRPGKLAETVFRAACATAVFVPLLVLAWLIGDVVATGLGRIDWSFFSNTDSMRPGRAGILPPLVGTLWLMILTSVISLPLGVGAAVYLEEYGKRSRIAGVIEVAIANLAGVPSVIYGLLGLALFVRAFGLGEVVIAGALTLSLLVLPVVIVSAREALRTVPDSLREAALGLGATRWQMVRKVVLPQALPGILTGAILATSRAIGETAPLVVVGAATFMTGIPDGIDSDFTALPMQVYVWTANAKHEYMVNAAAAIIVLMTTLLILNSAAIMLRNRYQRRI
ncbi:MAG: phosphate ABC transporter permease PstA [Myxococcales bacterium]|nr:phosphate ABC transporter permease PstA [Myxococcales bacterium]